jgi:hypothetical protein
VLVEHQCVRGVLKLKATEGVQNCRVKAKADCIVTREALTKLVQQGEELKSAQ